MNTKGNPWITTGTLLAFEMTVNRDLNNLQDFNKGPLDL